MVVIRAHYINWQ